MSKTLVLALLLLLSAAWAQALGGDPSSNADQKSASGLTTIQGCLQSASSQFTLTDSNGTVHRLSFSNKLTHHVGHEVQITGKPGVKTTETTTYGAGSSAEETPIFEVKTVTYVADTCKGK
jgi:Protein of unknown function (DUF5818)